MIYLEKLHRIHLKLGRFYVDNPRKSAVKFCAIWTNDTFNLDKFKQTIQLCAAVEEVLRPQVKQTNPTNRQTAPDRLSLQYDSRLLKICPLFAATEEKLTVPVYAALQHLKAYFTDELVRTVRN